MDILQEMVGRLLEHAFGAGKASKHKRMLADSAAKETGDVTAAVERVLSGHRMIRGSLMTQKSAAVFTVDIASNRDVVATGGADGTVRLWHSRAPAGGQILIETGRPVHSVRFSRDGKTLAAGGNEKQVHFWDLAQGPASVRKLDQVWRRDEAVFTLAWSHGARVACATSAGRVAVRTGWETKVKAPTLGVADLAFSPDGSHLLVPVHDGVQVMAADSGRAIRSLAVPKHNVGSVAWSPDGRLAAAGIADGTVRLWRVADGELRHTLRAHAPMTYSEGEPVGKVAALAFAPSGRFLASGGWDGVVKIWRVVDGALLRNVLPGRSLVHGLAWTSNGERLAVATHDGTAQLWTIK